MSKEEIQIVLWFLQVIIVPLVLWMARKLLQIHRSIKLNNYKHSALVEALSKQFGNGEFKKDYDKNVDRLKSDYKFIYKE